jgi:hypothetical protein
MLLKKLMFYIPDRELLKFAAFSGSAKCWPIPYRTLEKSRRALARQPEGQLLYSMFR